MDIGGFWDLVERSARETGSRQERVDWLKDHLARLPAEEIVDYEAWFTVCANRACTWDMYAACWMITGSGSSDGFELSRNFSHERTSTSGDGLFRLGRVTRIRSSSCSRT